MEIPILSRYDEGEPLATSVISKADSYGLGATATRAYGRLNGQTIWVNATPALAWNHLVMTYDGSQQKLYLNGVLVTSQALSGGININTNNLAIGSGQSSYLSRLDNYFEGRIDEVLIYNQALSEEEIRERYVVYGGWLKSALANDNSNGGPGIQSDDQVVITFNHETYGTPVDQTNIDSALALSGDCTSCTWLDGSGNIGSAVWSDSVYSNDILTITLSTTGGDPDLIVGDTVTLGGIIENKYNKAIADSVPLYGSFAGLPPGAVAFWNFMEGSGEIAGDISGSGNDGALRNNPAWSIYGKTGGALDFDGVDDYVEVEDSPSLTVTDVSLEAWVKTTDKTDNKHIISNYAVASSAQWYHLSIVEETGYARFQVDDGTDTPYVEGTSDLADGSWHHIVGVRDAANNELRIYVDSSEENTDTDTSTGSLNPAANLWLGGQFSEADRYFNGRLDEVIVYNTALNSSDVQARYDARGANLTGVLASDSSGGGIGLQAGDQVVIRFDAGTNASPCNITDANIDSILALDSGSWLGSGTSTISAAWSTTNYTNDTLTITYTTVDTVNPPTIAAGAMVTLNADIDCIKDVEGNVIRDYITLTGSFDLAVVEGLVAYWRFEEASGSTAFDGSGYENDGTISVGVTLGVAGKSGQAFSFDGVDDYIEAANSGSLAVTSALTLESWVKGSSNQYGDGSEGNQDLSGVVNAYAYVN